jgi:hypothetical protein
MERSEVKKLLGKSENDLLLEWFDAEMRDKVGGSAEDIAGITTNLSKLFSKWSITNLRDLVCSEWDYCDKRKKLGKSIELVAQLGEFIYSSLKMPGNVPFSLAVLIVMHGFDEFCGCQES